MRVRYSGICLAYMRALCCTQHQAQTPLSECVDTLLTIECVVASSEVPLVHGSLCFLSVTTFQ